MPEFDVRSTCTADFAECQTGHISPHLKGFLEYLLLLILFVIEVKNNRPLSLDFHVETRGRKKALFSHGKPRPDANSVQGLPGKSKAFCSPETPKTPLRSQATFSSRQKRDKVSSLDWLNQCRVTLFASSF